jgi:hypothetical protein
MQPLIIMGIVVRRSRGLRQKVYRNHAGLLLITDVICGTDCQVAQAVNRPSIRFTTTHSMGIRDPDVAGSGAAADRAVCAAVSGVISVDAPAVTAVAIARLVVSPPGWDLGGVVWLGGTRAAA